MNVAIIPARGGSKRIPRKNIKRFHDKPMIAYPIQAAIDSECFDRIIVSTDDDEIAAIAVEYGAEVPFIRPQELADDYVGTTPVIRHALKELSLSGCKVDYCCCIYATTPLLTPEILKQGFQILKCESELDYVFSAARFSFPIQRALVKIGETGVKPFDRTSIPKRSQDLTPTYHDAGQFYWGKTKAFLDENSQVFGPNSSMLVLPNHLVQDIDTEEDWQRAELLFSIMQREKTL